MWAILSFLLGNSERLVLELNVRRRGIWRENQGALCRAESSKFWMGIGKQQQRRPLQTSKSRRNEVLNAVLRFSLIFLLLAPLAFFLFSSRVLYPLVLENEGPGSFGLKIGSLNEVDEQSKQSLEVLLLDKPRLAVKRLLSIEQPEGDGALVRRSIGRPELKQLDPFLLLDHFAVSPPAGFPDHPHRGFETVTYMLEGAFTHQDFDGHKGTIGPGDLQWMTAGRGIVHCELPAKKGVQRGLQLWVNLPRRYKMVEPKYQELDHKNVAKVEKDGVKVAIIAGESFGIKSPVYTLTPIMFLDFTLEPGAEVHQLVPEGWNAFVYVIDGSPTLGTKESGSVDAFHTVQLGPGNRLSVWNTKGKICRFLLIGGEPLNEPVVQYGPFVMNSQEEIRRAVYDYQTGQNGFEKARTWQSTPLYLA